MSDEKPFTWRDKRGHCRLITRWSDGRENWVYQESEAGEADLRAALANRPEVVARLAAEQWPAANLYECVWAAEALYVALGGIAEQRDVAQTLDGFVEHEYAKLVRQRDAALEAQRKAEAERDAETARAPREDSGREQAVELPETQEIAAQQFRGVIAKRALPDAQTKLASHAGRWRILASWANQIAARYARPVYLVGSAIEQDSPRDYDVVCIISDREFFHRYGGNWGDAMRLGSAPTDANRQWSADVAKISAQACEQHNMNVDFKVQAMVEANRHIEKPRVRLDTLGDAIQPCAEHLRQTENETEVMPPEEQGRRNRVEGNSVNKPATSSHDGGAGVAPHTCIAAQPTGGPYVPCRPCHQAFQWNGAVAQRDDWRSRALAADQRAQAAEAKVNEIELRAMDLKIQRDSAIGVARDARGRAETAEAKVAAWEPAMRAAFSWYEDTGDIDLLDDELDAIPPELRPEPK